MRWCLTDLMRISHLCITCFQVGLHGQRKIKPRLAFKSWYDYKVKNALVTSFIQGYKEEALPSWPQACRTEEYSKCDKSCGFPFLLTRLKGKWRIVNILYIPWASQHPEQLPLISVKENITEAKYFSLVFLKGQGSVFKLNSHVILERR